MSVDSVLDSGISLLLEKARRGLGGTSPVPTTGGGGDSGTTAPVRPATINFEWSGGGSAIVQSLVDPILAEVPFPCRITWVHLRAGDAAGNPQSVDAEVAVTLSQFETFGGSSPLNASGTTPQLAGTSKQDTSLSGWKIDLTTGDTITARLTAFSGVATWMTLTLLLRPTDVPISVSPIVDNSGNQLVDSNGNPLVFKGGGN